jgi:hypothetical protein
MPDAVTFWYGPHSWLYTCALGANRYEITTMTRDLAEQSEKEKVSWGQDATTQKMADNFKVSYTGFAVNAFLICLNRISHRWSRIY